MITHLCQCKFTN